uniref:RNA-binding protein Luc7-like 2 n=1 Tax=Macrostomum lignano TaxID=282301 RepID=A0A1I8GN75_9PLAT
MSATEQMRAMLDELMGTNRDGEKPKLRFDDPSVCKCFLLGCCPHEILQGTRMDIGDCPNVHDVALKADYTQARDRRRYNFEYDALNHLENFIGECDRRTEQAKKRLRDTQEDLSEDASEKAELISKLGEEIGTKLANAEKLGAEGKVDESLKLMKEVDELSRKKGDVEKEFRDCMPNNTYQQQKLRVCEICSAFLGIHDNDRRLADHFGGKLHLGFIEIREHLSELRATVKAMREERSRSRRGSSSRHSFGGGGGNDDYRQGGGGGEGRSRSRSRSSRRRHRSRSKSSSRASRKRHHHHRGSDRHSRRDSRSRSISRDDKDRERGRDRDRERNRDRDRDHRSSASKKSRRRSRSRSRSKSRGKDGNRDADKNRKERRRKRERERQRSGSESSRPAEAATADDAKKPKQELELAAAPTADATLSKPTEVKESPKRETDKQDVANGGGSVAADKDVAADELLRSRTRQ